MLLNKRRKQGFTLIELLAVIIVLVFIMVIIIPETMRVIEKSRKKTFENSMKNLTKAISLKQKELMLDKAPKMLKFEYNDGVESSNISLLSLDYDGKTPENGIIVINRNGKTSLALHNGTYCATKNFFDDDIIIEKKSKEECTIILGDKTFLIVLEDEVGQIFLYKIISIDDGYIGMGIVKIVDENNNLIENGIIVKLNLDGEIIWVNNFDSSYYDIYEVISNSEDEYVAVGLSTEKLQGHKGNTDGIIVKYDANGNKKWLNVFGGSGYEYFNSVTSTTDGGYIAVGESDSTNIEDMPLNGLMDAIIVKYDADGNEEWAKNYGDENTDEFTYVIGTTDGGSIAIGRNSGTIFYLSTAIIVKYDADGNEEWAKAFGGANDYFNSVSITSNGEYIVNGRYCGGDSPTCSNYIVKYNVRGEIIGDLSLDSNWNYSIYDIITAIDGGYIAVGADEKSYPNITQSGIIVKYNADGNAQWKRKYGDENDYTIFNSINQANNGILEGYIIGGFSNSYELINKESIGEGIILKVDLEGNLDLNP